MSLDCEIITDTISVHVVDCVITFLFLSRSIPFSHWIILLPIEESSWLAYFLIGSDSKIGRKEPFRDSINDSLNLSVSFFIPLYFRSDFINSSFKFFSSDFCYSQFFSFSFKVEVSEWMSYLAFLRSS
jgi:hypothetical protein